MDSLLSHCLCWYVTVEEDLCLTGPITKASCKAAQQPTLHASISSWICWSQASAMLCCRVLLVVGGADNAVRVYLREADGQCTALCKLQGHTDWVTSVAFTSSGEPGKSDSHLPAQIAATYLRWLKWWGVHTSE